MWDVGMWECVDEGMWECALVGALPADAPETAQVAEGVAGGLVVRIVRPDGGVGGAVQGLSCNTMAREAERCLDEDGRVEGDAVHTMGHGLGLQGSPPSDHERA